MLSFDIRSLEAHAVHVDGELAADDAVWEEGDLRPATPIHATGRLSAAGAGRFYWSGRVTGTARAECRRCLKPAEARVQSDVQLLFAEAGSAEADDPDVYVIDPRDHELDLRPAIREQWLLSAPVYALCEEACKGLCPTCGADLNAGPCDCAQAADSRWDALRHARGNSN